MKIEDSKKVYFSVNKTKLENEEKLNDQINNIINYISNRYSKSFKKATFYMGFNGDDFFRGKFTLEIKFYL